MIQPRRGARVDELDLKHAEGLYACRLMIEPQSIRLAVVSSLTDNGRHVLQTLFS